jgi:glycosyltransferase involved in cell wall biosynthesis
MRVAILALTRGQYSGGTRKHLEHLVPLLRQHPDVESVHLFVPPALAGPGDHTWPAGDDLLGFQTLRRALSELRPDVALSLAGRAVRVPGIPLVTMIRNMEPLEVPFGGNRLGEAVKNLARAYTARATCRKADRIIAVSNHVRDFLVQRWHISPERIGVVRHGVDPAIGEPPEPPAFRDLRGGRFLFAAGSIRPARGLEDLIEAMSGLPEDVVVLIAGSIDRRMEHYRRKITRLAEKRGVASRLHWLGLVDAETLSWCYRHAAVFVMTSRAEACPNIVLEALAAGALSVSTNHPPMPELFADAAAYYQERDSGDLAARIREVLSSSEETQRHLRESARLRAASFTWEATAMATVAELRRARGC